jgi:hypothetical protein
VDDIANGDISVMHELTSDGYRLTAINKADGMFLMSWLMSPQDALSLSQVIQSTILEGMTT